MTRTLVISTTCLYYQYNVRCLNRYNFVLKSDRQILIDCTSFSTYKIMRKKIAKEKCPKNVPYF